MELINEFEVAVPVDQAWAVLTDVERIAPCLPGAQLQEVEGDQYRGLVKVKVGPITASYKGVAHFETLDAKKHRAVLKAEGRETRGQGNASATITASLSDKDGKTQVHVVTELAITGKVAQFGRGVLAEVSAKLLGQFVDNLEATVLVPVSADEEAELAELAELAEAVVEAVEDITIEIAEELIAEGVDEVVAIIAAEEIAEQIVADELAEEVLVAEMEEALEEELEELEELADAAEAEAEDSGAAESEPEAPSEAEAEAGPGGEAEAVAEAEATEEEAPRPCPEIRKIESAPVEPVDLMEVAGPSLAKRVIPFASVAGALFLIRIIIYAMRRRKK